MIPRDLAGRLWRACVEADPALPPGWAAWTVRRVGRLVDVPQGCTEVRLSPADHREVVAAFKADRGEAR